MKRKVILFLALVVIIFHGCTNDETDKDFFLDKKIKSEASPVKIDTIGFFEDLIYARQFFVYQDTILIVQNRKYEDVYFVEFYDLKRQQLLRRFFRLGNGPYEMLSGYITINGDVLTVNDYIKNQVAFVNIDSVLQNPLYSVPVIRHYYNTPTAVRYREGELLLENPYCFQSKELGIDQKAPRFIIAIDKMPYLETKSYQYYTRNVATDGKIITDYEKNRILYVSMSIPRLEIYDNDLTLIKLVHGPDKLPATYKIDEDNSVSFYQAIPFTYMNFCTSTNFVYLMYIGDYLIPKKNHMEDLPVWIFKFDWDGNFLDSYSIGRYITSISLSADGQSIYATAINEEKNPFLIQIKFNEN